MDILGWWAAFVPAGTRSPSSTSSTPGSIRYSELTETKKFHNTYGGESGL